MWTLLIVDGCELRPFTVHAPNHLLVSVNSSVDGCKLSCWSLRILLLLWPFMGIAHVLPHLLFSVNSDILQGLHLPTYWQTDFCSLCTCTFSPAGVSGLFLHLSIFFIVRTYVQWSKCNSSLRTTHEKKDLLLLFTRWLNFYSANTFLFSNEREPRLVTMQRTALEKNDLLLLLLLSFTYWLIFYSVKHLPLS